MSYLKTIFLIVFYFSLTSCAVSEKPEEQSSIDVIVGSTTGQFDKFLQAMRDRLDNLNERAEGISQALDDYNAQLFHAKRELAKYQISEQERDELRADIATIQQQTTAIENMNKHSISLIAARENEIEQKNIAKEQLKSSIEETEEQVLIVEKQATVIEDGIKRIAAIRAKNALQN
ncbi:hypothetical protein Q4574_16805 [Aliiglaciecola sp. 3_MG-2023]|uniref:hypothetical protein n=1 Tax=Aliiglaciecola sp. 3_MG-2023 TaxID=3062644 RepID=UPI0026E242D0|nr:hypothetical protein [Aliiglaciecola sp. 3_MG-2023]MDO6694960.1 hypothetical protein [Aliiglaciecola sp. 3_MG-2023]